MNVSYTSISIGWREKPVKRIYNQVQGNRIFLSSQDVAKGVFTPARFEPPGFDATCGRLFLLEQIEGHVP